VSSLCLAHHAVRLWRSPRRWSRGATNPVQIRWKSHVSFPLSQGRWPSLIRRNRWLWALKKNQESSIYPSESGRVKVGGTMMSFPTTTKWRQRAPSWSTTLGLRHVYTEKRRSSRRARVQEELNMIHYPRAAACIFTRLRAEESSDFIEAHCGVPSREKPYEIVIYLHVCVFDLWYFRVRVLLRMWQEI